MGCLGNGLCEELEQCGHSHGNFFEDHEVSAGAERKAAEEDGSHRRKYVEAVVTLTC